MKRFLVITILLSLLFGLNSWTLGQELIRYEELPFSTERQLASPIGKTAGKELFLDLWYIPVVRPYFPDAKRVAEIIQADLDAIGVKTSLVTYDWGDYINRTRYGEHDMCLLGWSADFADPDNILYSLLHSNSAVIGSAANVAFYKNDLVDTLLTEGRQTFYRPTRNSLYKDACWFIHKDAPWMPVAHSQKLAGHVNDVSGFVIHPSANVYANVSKSGSTVLIIARGSDSVTLDPAEWWDEQSWKVGRQIYDGLYNLPADSTDPEPGLATNYSVSSDGLEWTFSLRQGVKFHDGTDFNASAVVFSFERAANWNNPASEYYLKGWVPPDAGYYDYIFGYLDLVVTEIDPYKVKFTMNKKYSPFLASLSESVFSIVSPSYVKTHNGTANVDRLGLNPVGTGPYKMKEWVVDETITLEKNIDYWSAAPLENELVFKVIPEAATRISELLAGVVDIDDSIAVVDAKTVEEASSAVLISQSGSNIGYLAMNTLKAPFDNATEVEDPDYGGKITHGALVRRAFNYAINKDTIIEEVFQGYGIKAKNPIPPSFLGYNDTIKEYPYDPIHAREIMSSLGYSVPVFPPEFRLVQSSLSLDTEGKYQFTATIENEGAPATTGLVPISWEEFVYDLPLVGGIGTLEESVVDYDLNGDGDKSDSFEVIRFQNETRQWDAIIKDGIQEIHAYSLVEGPPETPRIIRTYYINGKPKLFQLGSEKYSLVMATEDSARLGLGKVQILKHPGPNFELVFEHPGTYSRLKATDFKINEKPVEEDHEWTGLWLPVEDEPWIERIYVVPNQASEISSGEKITFSCTITANDTVNSDIYLIMNWSPDENLRHLSQPYFKANVEFEVPTTPMTTGPTTITGTTTTTKPAPTTTRKEISIDTPGFSLLATLMILIPVLIHNRKK